MEPASARVDERARATACANCAARSFDPLREGWHVFDDGLDEEHAVCLDCTRDTPSRWVSETMSAGGVGAPPA